MGPLMPRRGAFLQVGQRPIETAGGQGRQADEDSKGRLAELERALRDSEAKVP